MGGDKTVSQGYILMAPSHTSFINTPSHVLQNCSPSKTNGRWDTCIKNEYRKTSEGSRGKEEGYVLCLPNTVKPSNTVNVTNLNTSQSNNLAKEQMNESAQDCSSSCNELSNDALPQAPVKENTEKCIRLSYSNGMGAAQGIGSSPGAGKSFKASAPKRGDLVSFIKVKGGRVRDVTVIKHASADILKGTLTNININEGKAKFNSLTKEPNIYEISLSEVISCNIKILNEKDSVEGIFHDGSIFGVCRTADLYLESTLGKGLTERPRLNITVKKALKDSGGKIIAQSGMAKGPDETNGFRQGWTTRQSLWAIKPINDTIDG